MHRNMEYVQNVGHIDYCVFKAKKEITVSVGIILEGSFIVHDY